MSSPFYEIKQDIENTGRYWVRDMQSNRLFCVEPIRDRNEKENDRVFTNGGIDGTDVKNKSQVKGGATLESNSIITEQNGFKNIRYGSNPMDIIETMLLQDILVKACQGCGFVPCQCKSDITI